MGRAAASRFVSNRLGISMAPRGKWSDTGPFGVSEPRIPSSTRLRTHYGNQKVTVAAMQMAEKIVRAQRS